MSTRVEHRALRLVRWTKKGKYEERQHADECWGPVREATLLALKQSARHVDWREGEEYMVTLTTIVELQRVER